MRKWPLGYKVFACVAPVLALAAMAGFYFPEAFTPPRLTPEQAPAAVDYARYAPSYCGVGVVSLRDAGYARAQPVGMPVTRGGDETIIICQATWARGELMVHVRPVCTTSAGLAPECSRVELIQDAETGDVLWLYRPPTPERERGPLRPN